MNKFVEIPEDAISDFLMQKQTHERYHLLIDTSLFENLIADISSVNAFCTKRWLWEGTFLEEHKKNGPLMIRFDSHDDPLLEFFISDSNARDKGILFISDIGLEKILEHLHRNIFAVLPDGSKAMLRIFDPRKLAGVIGSLSDNKLERLFGALGRILWREPCFDIGRYLVLEFPDSQSQASSGELCIDKEELQAIDKYSAKHFIKSMSRMLVAKHKVDEHKADDAAIHFSRKAYSYSIDTEKDIEEYISLSIENTELMKTPMMESILSQEEPSAKKLILIRNYIEYCKEGELAHA